MLILLLLLLVMRRVSAPPPRRPADKVIAAFHKLRAAAASHSPPHVFLLGRLLLFRFPPPSLSHRSSLGSLSVQRHKLKIPVLVVKRPDHHSDPGPGSAVSAKSGAAAIGPPEYTRDVGAPFGDEGLCVGGAAAEQQRLQGVATEAPAVQVVQQAPSTPAPQASLLPPM